MSEKINTEIAIVGAGLVGLSAAIACAKLGKKVVLIDNQAIEIKTLSSDFDTRIYALTPPSVAWLQSIGVWEFVDTTRVTPIASMQLWQHDAADALVLADSDAHVENLGVIIENQNLMQALQQQLNTLDVTVMTDAVCQNLENTLETNDLTVFKGQKTVKIQAKLLLAADGAGSWVRQATGISVKTKDFNQTALVANFVTQKPHNNAAMQWFRPHDTLALLPLSGQKVSLVWSLSTERAVELLNQRADVFAAAVTQHTNGVLGDLTNIGEVKSFALQQQTANDLVADKLVLLGDAAHTIHPLAGQGVNLGFRDVMVLETQLNQLHSMQTIADAQMLKHYARLRKLDVTNINSLTSGLDSWFAEDNEMIKNVSNWGFKRLNGFKMAKKLLIQQVA